MGSDYRKFLLNFTQLFFPSGQFAFNNAQWTQRNPNVSSGDAGRPRWRRCCSASRAASTSATIRRRRRPARTGRGYVQDDWRIARNLTINLGLRYEFDVPRTERFDRLAYFDADAPSPLAGRRAGESVLRSVAAARARSCSWMPTTGGRWTTDYNNFSPAPRRSPGTWPTKTVIRSGWGIFYMPSHVQAAGHSGSVRHDRLQHAERHDRQPGRPHPAPDDRQSVPRRLQPAAGQLARRVDESGPRHRRRHRRRVHDEPGAAHAAVERQRAARAAGQHASRKWPTSAARAPIC